jgi:hypothetical protein
VAAADAPYRFAGTSEGTIFVDRVDGVLAAGGCKAAVAAEEAADGCAIEKNNPDQQAPHHLILAH